MSKSKLINTNVKPLRRVPLPSTVGLAVLGLAVVLIWGGIFFYPDRWQVTAPSSQARSSQSDEQPQATPPQNILMGPQVAPSTRSFYEYTERLEEQSAIVLSLSLSLLHENLKFRRVPKDLPTLVKTTQARGLWQPTWEISQKSDAVKTKTSVHFLRYRVVPVSVEVLTVSLTGDIQMTVMRLPEADGAPIKFNADNTPEGQAGAVILISPTTDVPLPPPFTSTVVYEQNGWRREPFKMSFTTEARRNNIRRWVEKESKYLEAQQP